MIGEWLLYAVVLSALVSVAAWLAERGTRAQQWSARWVWAGALLASAVLPLWSWLRPAAVPDATPIAAIPGAYVMQSLPPLTAGSVAPSGPSLEAMLLSGWALATLGILGFVLVLAGRLHRRRRGWRSDVVDGVEVLVSRDTGPAALGLIRGRVVLPEWALGLSAEQRRLLIAHEAEHVRARDPQLAFLGLILAALAPWNLPLWWQLRRLRLAIEMDCDARVLRAVDDRRGYGALLLEIGQRRTRLALALAEPKSMLERRIRMIMTPKGRATARAAGMGALAGLALVVACETPGPTALGSPETTVATELEATKGALAGMDCEPLLYINDARGSRTELDELAPDGIESVHVLKPGPERADGAACGVIVVITKAASVSEKDAARRMIEALGQARREPTEVRVQRSLEDVRGEPTFTPMTVRPQLTNPGDVKKALQENYPPLLKDAGIGGTANVWFLLDTEGRVVETRINRSSDHDALDEAALKVAEIMDFTPAYNRDVRVPVWVALDVKFESGKMVDRANEQAKESGLEAEGERRLRERLDAAAERRRAEIREQAARAELEADRSAQPTFTPMTEHPKLRNTRDVSESLMSLYPPVLRDAGIGGTANVWFFIDETGKVRKTAINRSSGYEALDAAALKAAERMEFIPARNGDEAVAVWVALDVKFEVQ